MCQYHCQSQAHLSCCSFTDTIQTSTFQSVGTSPSTEYPTATGRQHSACPDCTCLCIASRSSTNQTRDRHSRTGNNADDVTDDAPGPSSSQPPASYPDNSSSSHSHSQQSSHNMSTVAHSGAGSSFTRHATALQRSDHLPQLASLIPRSALQESSDSILEDGISRANSLLDAKGYRSLNIDISMGAQSSQSIEVIHDGKVTKLVTRFEAHAASRHSDASQAPHNDHPDARTSLHQGSVSDAATICAPSSPRKPIPSHWLPPSNGQNLATAQRAKERVHKKGSLSGSPVEVKALRGTRSLVDIGGAHGTDGASFLTKTAHSAIESDLTSGKSPTKGQRAPSKPAWNSPTSPRREHAQQQPNLIIKTSPIKKAYLSAESASLGHRRGTSVATSAGDSVYHSAKSSPVRSSADSMSLEPIPDFFTDKDPMSDLELNADSGNEQGNQRPSLAHTLSKTATVGRGGRPTLKLDIPPTNPRSDATDEVLAPHALPMSGPWSPQSASSVSRIPRVAATDATSARSPTLSSTLKQAQSFKSLSSYKTRRQLQGHDAHNLQPSSPPKSAIRHVRTVNSSGSTPILSKYCEPQQDQRRDSTLCNTEDDSLPTHYTQATTQEAAVMSELESNGSRASSMSTVKATPAVADPVLVDPAIIYSKRSETSGMAFNQPSNVPSIVVMMTHHIDTDTFLQHNSHGDAATATPSLAHDSIEASIPVRGRSEHFIPSARRQEESEHSLQSSLSSDLRATAAEFVPHPPPVESQEKTETSSPIKVDPTTDLLGPMKYELDMYGIPWYYYMYQVQFAYDQGYQKGRSKSPKKTRKKQHRTLASSPTDAPHQPRSSEALASFVPKQEQQGSSSMPPPASTAPLAEQRAQKRQENAEAQQNDASTTSERPFSPFAAQKEFIDRQYAFSGFTVTDRPPPGIDLTSVRNVPLHRNDHPRRDQNYNGSRRHNCSDNGLYNYRGRGIAGVRMQDTVPFPNPVPPQGRPANSVVGIEACGVVDITYAADCVGGIACHDCEPDHPLD
jgi:hypothetical protein